MCVLGPRDILATFCLMVAVLSSKVGGVEVLIYSCHSCVQCTIACCMHELRGAKSLFAFGPYKEVAMPPKNRFGSACFGFWKFEKSRASGACSGPGPCCSLLFGLHVASPCCGWRRFQKRAAL